MRLGVLIKTLGISQQGLFLTLCGNKLAQERGDIDFTVFYEDHDKLPLFVQFCMMQNSNIWGFNGPLIATDLQLAETLLACPSPTRKLLYVWNLEWLYDIGSFGKNTAVYLNDELELIARSQAHYDIIKKCWKEPSMIVEDFDYEAISKIAK